MLDRALAYLRTYLRRCYFYGYCCYYYYDDYYYYYYYCYYYYDY